MVVICLQNAGTKQQTPNITFLYFSMTRASISKFGFFVKTVLLASLAKKKLAGND